MQNPQHVKQQAQKQVAGSRVMNTKYDNYRYPIVFHSLMNKNDDKAFSILVW